MASPKINQVTEEESFKEIGQLASLATTGPSHAFLQSPELLGLSFNPFLSSSGVVQSCHVCAGVCACAENDKQPHAQIDTIKQKGPRD